MLLVAALVAGAFAWRQRAIASSALRDVETEYQAALDQAAGSVAFVVRGNQEGAVKTKIMGQLVERGRETVVGLPNQTDASAAAQIKLLNALSGAYLWLDGGPMARDMADRANALARRRFAGTRTPPIPHWDTTCRLGARGHAARRRGLYGRHGYRRLTARRRGRRAGGARSRQRRRTGAARLAQLDPADSEGGDEVRV